MKLGKSWIDFVRVAGTNVLEWALHHDGTYNMYKFLGTTQKMGHGRYRYCTFDRRQSGYVSSEGKAARLLYSYLSLAPHERKQVVMELKPDKEGLERRLPEPPDFRQVG